MNICIVGLGVIGGSYAMSLKEIGGHNVYAIDKDICAIKKASQMGLIIEGFTSGKEILNKCDLVILSIYPDAIVNFLKENMMYFKKDSIITDATGIKGVIVQDIESILRSDIKFVFGHPMAGREKKGLDYASSKVFKGANYIITPTKRTSKEAIDCIESLALSIGFKRVTKISPEAHDALIAFTSQLPHIIAVALINSDDEKYDTGKFIGDSYKELTRISNINGPLWAELFLNNKENLLRCIENFEEQLDILKDGLKYENVSQLMELFQKSSARRERLD